MCVGACACVRECMRARARECEQACVRASNCCTCVRAIVLRLCVRAPLLASLAWPCSPLPAPCFATRSLSAPSLSVARLLSLPRSHSPSVPCCPSPSVTRLLSLACCHVLLLAFCQSPTITRLPSLALGLFFASFSIFFTVFPPSFPALFSRPLSPLSFSPTRPVGDRPRRSRANAPAHAETSPTSRTTSQTKISVLSEI